MASEFGLLTDDDLRGMSRELFRNLDLNRASESDYAVAIKALRDVYNRGRTRGAYERPEGQ